MVSKIHEKGSRKLPIPGPNAAAQAGSAGGDGPKGAGSGPSAAKTSGGDSEKPASKTPRPVKQAGSAGGDGPA